MGKYESAGSEFAAGKQQNGVPTFPAEFRRGNQPLGGGNGVLVRNSPVLQVYHPGFAVIEQEDCPVVRRETGLFEQQVGAENLFARPVEQ